MTAIGEQPVATMLNVTLHKCWLLRLKSPLISAKESTYSSLVNKRDKMDDILLAELAQLKSLWLVATEGLDAIMATILEMEELLDHYYEYLEE